MPRAQRSKTGDAKLDAAVEYFASRSHDDWRKTLLQTNPDQKGKPRMRQRGGVMVDVNQPWVKLHPKAKLDNMNAARDAYAAVKKFPNDREAAAADVHVSWVKRNKSDPNQPKELFKPYAKLPDVEKDKDRAHVDAMKKAIAAVSARVPKKAAKSAKKAPARKAAASTSVRIDPKALRRLELAAKQLSTALGKDVPLDVLVNAGVEAAAGIAKAVAAGAKRR